MSNVRVSEASYILAKRRCFKAHNPALASYQTCSGTTWPSPCHRHCEPIPSVTHSLVTATRRDFTQQQGSLFFGISGVCAVSMCTYLDYTTPPTHHSDWKKSNVTDGKIIHKNILDVTSQIRTASEVWRTFLGNT